MKKLISMTDFVISDKVKSQLEYVDAYKLIRNYANFLKQLLELWMFVPCDEDGNVLEEPKIENMPFCSVNGEGYDYAILKYQQAKERCLFEGFEVVEYSYLPDNKSIAMAEILHVFWHNKIIGWKLSTGVFVIEDLVKYNLTLTQTAIKQIGL